MSIFELFPADVVVSKKSKQGQIRKGLHLRHANLPRTSLLYRLQGPTSSSFSFFLFCSESEERQSSPSILRWLAGVRLLRCLIRRRLLDAWELAPLSYDLILTCSYSNSTSTVDRAYSRSVETSLSRSFPLSHQSCSWSSDFGQRHRSIISPDQVPRLLPLERSPPSIRLNRGFYPHIAPSTTTSANLLSLLPLLLPQHPYDHLLPVFLAASTPI